MEQEAAEHGPSSGVLTDPVPSSGPAQAVRTPQQLFEHRFPHTRLRSSAQGGAQGALRLCHHCSGTTPCPQYADFNNDDSRSKYLPPVPLLHCAWSRTSQSLHYRKAVAVFTFVWKHLELAEPGQTDAAGGESASSTAATRDSEQAPPRRGKTLHPTSS